MTIPGPARFANGKYQFICAFIMGALAVSGLPPFYIVPVYWICFPTFLLLLQNTKTGSGAFFLGWGFGLGYFVPGLYWISIALTVDLARFWWLMPLAVLGLPSLFAIYWGLASFVSKSFSVFLAGKFPVCRFNKEGKHCASILLIILFPLLLTLAEYARGHLFTGFPWNLPGYGWVNYLPVLQSVSVIGIYGLTFLTILIACLPFLFYITHPAKAVLVNATGVAVFIVIGIWGAQRLISYPTAFQPDITLRLVQPDIAQNLKWDMNERIANFRTLLRLSSENRPAGLTHIIWPETAVPFIIDEDPDGKKLLASLVPEQGLLITGAIRRDDHDTLYNSIQALDQNGNIIGAYDKFHLVPFGEYMPFRNFLPIPALAKFSDLGRGAGLQTFNWNSLPPLSALVCYEVIFPNEVVNKNAVKPQWLLNVTNDAWYGNSTGPYQHLAIAITRAVEEGVPLVRVANTGISAVIDPVGRTIVKTKLNEQIAVDSKLPKPLP